MTVTIRDLKYSFPVIGRPVSLQSSPHSKQRYRKQVAEAARRSVDKPVESREGIRIEIDWFSEGVRNKPDVDNIIKLIEDALKGYVFLDDSQVESVEARRHDTTSVMRFIREPLCIVEPLMKGDLEYVFVRIY